MSVKLPSGVYRYIELMSGSVALCSERGAESSVMATPRADGLPLSRYSVSTPSNAESSRI